MEAPPPPYAHGPHTYEPLEQGSIRLLVLLEADEFHDDLEGGLIHISLADADADKAGDNAYTALSYVWGDLTDPSIIYFNDKILHIGKNLDSALRRLRRKDKPILIWVDAICIDQSNVQERNYQVQHMRDIYASAQETIVYLGEQTGNNTGRSAWNYLERHAEWALNENQEVDYDRPRQMEDLVDFRGTLYDIHDDVLVRAWFTRVWVLQEVVVSKRISIQCGDRRIPWDDFCKTIVLSKRRHDQYGLSLNQEGKFEVIRMMFRTRVGYHISGRGQGMSVLPSWYQQVAREDGASTDILKNLERARHFNATDLRDKIIALLGISTNFDWISHKTVNYGIPSVELYTKFAQDHLEDDSDYALLSFREPFGLRNNSSHLPSWVPDWAISSSRYGTRRLSTLFPEEIGADAKARRFLVRRWRTWVGEGLFMTIRGSIIGTVAVSQSAHLLGVEEVAFQELREKWEKKNVTIKEDDKMDEGNEESMDNVSWKGETAMLPVESYILSLWAHFLDMERYYIRSGRIQVSEAANRSGRFSLDTLLSIPPGSRCPLSDEYQGSRDWEENSKEIFLNHINMASPPAPNSIEEHLVKRARTTTSWSDVWNPAVKIVVDKESIIDGRNLGTYEPYVKAGQRQASSPPLPEKVDEEADLGESPDGKAPSRVGARDSPARSSSPGAGSSGRHKLVLLPAYAEKDDLVVYFPGARTPFLLRQVRHIQSEAVLDEAYTKLGGKDEEPAVDYSFYHFVGECWMNNFEDIVNKVDKFEDGFVIV